MIYELCLSDVGLIQPFKERLQPLQGEYIPFSARERFSRQTLGLSPNLLATCRQINEEATRILYGRHFSVVTGFEIGAGLGDFGLKFLDHIGSQNCQFIRSLHTNECFSRIHDSSQRPIKNEIHLPWQGILFFKKVIPSLKNLRVLGTFVLGRRSERMKTQHLPGEAVIAKALACHPFLSRMEEYQPPAGCGRLYAILANGEVLEKVSDALLMTNS